MLAPQSLIDDLTTIVGANHVLEGDATSGQATDWTGRFVGETPAVVRPGSVAEVAALVRWARRTKTMLVPQGGNTGLVGGAQPLHGEVVVSLIRLDEITDVDADTGALTAGAGVTIAAVHEAADRVGWRYGVDFAARGSATVGGSIATNAGGLRVLRHGMTRAQVLGVQAVLGTGEIVDTRRGLVKDNTGYDLAQLLCGSEGTLGLVTSARLRLVAPAGATVTALVALDAMADAVEVVGAIRRSVPTLEAAEFMTADGLSLVGRQTGAESPFADPSPVYLLVEAVGPPDPTELLGNTLAGLASVRAVAVATDGPRQRALWHHREAHTASINRLGVPHKFDVTLPSHAIATFCDTVPAAISATASGASTWLFGHLGDGNVHVNVTGVDPQSSTDLESAVLSMVIAAGGSISAEHGIGAAKRDWLIRDRGTAAVSTMRAIKDALDPDDICNPHALLPAR